MRGSARNLCCTAIGQATALCKVSEFKDYTAEEHIAVRETVSMLRSTLLEMMRAIQALEEEREEFVQQCHHLEDERDEHK